MDVIGIGNPVMDLIVETQKIPERNMGGRMDSYSWQGGGKVPTAIAALARLGADCGIIGVVGNDDFGKFCINDLKRHGADVSNLIIDKEGRHNFCLCLAEKSSKTRTIIYSTGTARDIMIDDIDEKAIKEARFLHVSRMGRVHRAACEIAKGSNTKVVIDADSFSDEIDENLNLIDIFIGSEFYYEKKFSNRNYKENCFEMQKTGPEIVIFTLGDKGCVGVYKDKYFAIPTFNEVKVVDTTGAGDVFHGAFIYGMLQDWDIEEICRFSNAVSSIKCTRLGGRAGIPTIENVMGFLDNRTIDYKEIDKRVEFYSQGLKYLGR